VNTLPPASLTPEQLERIGWFLLAVLEWTPTPSPALPQIGERDLGEGVKRRKVARGVGS